MKYLMILILTLATMVANGQETVEYKDKLYTKDGSIIIGSITSYDPVGGVDIMMKNGKVISFANDQVKKVVMHQGEEIVTPVTLRKGRVYNETQFSLLTGVSGTGIGIAHSVLYQFHEKIGAGIGIGLDNYYVAPGRDIYPIFITAKYYLLDSKMSPYFGMRAGYGLAFKREEEDIVEANGGWMINPQIGLRLGTKKLMFNMFAGIKLQQADYEIVRPWESVSQDIFFKRIELGTSVMF